METALGKVLKLAVGVLIIPAILLAGLFLWDVGRSLGSSEKADFYDTDSAAYWLREQLTSNIIRMKYGGEVGHMAYLDASYNQCDDAYLISQDRTRRAFERACALVEQVGGDYLGELLSGPLPNEAVAQLEQAISIVQAGFDF